MDVTIWSWLTVLGVIVAALAVDLFAFHRDAHAVGLREAAVSSIVWIALGLAFGVVVWHLGGTEAAGEYYASYLLEKTLSVENVFVFSVVLGAFAVPAELRHRVLFLGVLGALVLRGVFVAAGAAVLDTFHWAIYLFGALIVVSGVRMLHRRSGPKLDPGHNVALRLLRRMAPVTDDFEGTRLVVRRGGRTWATPLLAALAVLETTDLVFAVDSVPAIFAVTDEPFLVFSATAFAMLGLRALYFVLAGTVARFPHLETGLAGVLVFVGVKMLLTEVVTIPVWASILVIGAILGLAARRGAPTAAPPAPCDDVGRDRWHAEPDVAVGTLVVMPARTLDVDLANASVFLDFDGTISTVDVGRHLLDRLGPPEWVELERRFVAGEISSRECVLDEWDLLPRDEAALRAVAGEVALDPGFGPLLDALRAAGAEATVVSDGFGFYVHEACRGFGVDVLTNEPDFTSWRLEFPNEDRCCPCSSCGTCKQTPIKDARYRGRTTVLVGDGTSDVKAAMLADVVFAKDDLARWCSREGVAYVPFAGLDDVAAALVPVAEVGA